MFKKTAIAALVVGLSGAASAAMYAPAPAPACSAGNVTVPCEKNAWDIGIDALYLKTKSNQFSNVNDFKAKSGWGFRVEGSYHFGTGNAVDINWAHYNKGTGVRQARMFRSKFDFVNLDFSQDIDVGENVDLQFLGGLQYARVVDNGFGGPTAGTNFRNTGFGPRVGAMLSYDFGNGFDIYAKQNFALLSMKQKNRTNPADFYGTGLSTDESIGLAYTRPMAQGDLVAHLAWTAAQINAGSTLGQTSWDGVLLGIKWIGNA